MPFLETKNFQQNRNQSPGPSSYRITLRGEVCDRIVVLEAENRKEATLAAERQNPGFHMVIAEVLR